MIVLTKLYFVITFLWWTIHRVGFTAFYINEYTRWSWWQDLLVGSGAWAFSAIMCAIFGFIFTTKESRDRVINENPFFIIGLGTISAILWVVQWVSFMYFLAK